MTDREEAIKGLESLRDVFNVRARGIGKGGMALAYYLSVVHLALALLREQKPVEPRYEDFFGNRIARCGYCNGYIVRYEYCPGCGRKVKWDD